MARINLEASAYNRSSGHISRGLPVQIPKALIRSRILVQFLHYHAAARVRHWQLPVKPKLQLTDGE